MSAITDELATSLAVAVTGGSARLVESAQDDLSRTWTFELDWGETPGAADLERDILIRLEPHGAYEARFEGGRDPFASGTMHETLATPAMIRIGTLIRISDPEGFATEMGVKGGGDVTPAHLEAGMLRLPVDPASAGISSLSASSLIMEGDKAYFEVTAEVADMAAMVRAAREAYNECWWDNTWLPSSPQEALFEIALGSNANPSPSDMGFEFLDYPQTRDAERIREAADTEVSASPALVPEGRVTYAEWLELTGLDDSFVGDGRERPGTRDLFYAAIRALPSPDASGPEPD
jgi:hypothetical protein